MLGKALTTAAAGSAAGGAAAGLGIEDVFSTWLYTGNGSTQTITNGIDLSGEGGLVWLKKRSATGFNWLHDSERIDGSGIPKYLSSNDTAAEGSVSNGLTGFNSDGFTLGNRNNWNDSGNTFASWTFRKAPGFFDVVTYTGNGTAGRTISHNLGSVPGCIIVKRLNGADNWTVQHRSLGGTKSLYLNLDRNEDTSSTEWNNTNPTSSVFTVGTSGKTNALNDTYVAYLFAHDEQIFGESGSESVVKCGSYTGTGTAGLQVNLGWEPQWLIVKRTDAAENWLMLDVMRHMSVTNAARLKADTSAAEAMYGGTYVDPLPNGFALNTTASSINGSGATYIYIAIRRGPMKTPTSGAEVYYQKTGAGPYPAGFPVDLWWTVSDRSSPAAFDPFLKTRLTGGAPYLTSSSTAAEANGSNAGFDNNDGFENPYNYTSSINWMFRRAPGFFDVVAYTGTGSATTVSHNLGAAPELMIVKRRDTADNWVVYHHEIGATPAASYYLWFTNASRGSSGNYFNDTAPTNSVLTVGVSNDVNGSGSTYIAYLFATVSGVSKVGSYTGTASTLNVDCGFTAGARYVLIKRTDASGDWYVWDSARGIISGNDPYYRLNVGAAQVTSTDYIDPYSAGFTISSSAPAAINASGGSYIFLSIA